MPRRKITLGFEEAWKVLCDAPREQDLVLDPIALLRQRGCSKATAIDLILELEQKKVLLPHCRGRSRKTIYAVTMYKEPPQKESAPVFPLPQSVPESKVPAPSEVSTPKEDGSRYRTSVSRVIVLVDRDNIMIPLERELKRPFPFEGVLRFAARNGGLEAAFFFCPLGTHKDEILLFRRHGFQVVIGQSVKEGQDRVDKALEDVGKLLLKNPDVGTLAIFSEDRDFSDLFVFAFGNGKRVFQFYVDVRKVALRSTDYYKDGEQIDIPAGKVGTGMTALTTRPRTVWRAIQEM